MENQIPIEFVKIPLVWLSMALSMTLTLLSYCGLFLKTFNHNNES